MPILEPVLIWELVADARVARLGTVDAELGVHLVPVTFALVGETIAIAVDHKPKRTRRLRRIANIERNHQVTVLVDQYDDEDWTGLWWCRLSGRARVLYQGDEFERAIDALVEKYEQYAEVRPAGPVIKIAVTALSGWAAEGD